MAQPRVAMMVFAGCAALAPALACVGLYEVLFGMTPLVAASFASAPALLVSAALAACFQPTRRAAAVDPAEALRCE